MKKRSLKFRMINALIMDIPLCVSMVIAAQLLGTGTLRLNLSLINFVLAYTISFFVGVFVPLVPLGLAFASKCGTQPGTLPFGLAVNVVVNLGFTLFNGVFLGHAPVIAFVMGLLTSFVPLYIVGYIVSFLWNTPSEKITERICGE